MRPSASLLSGEVAERYAIEAEIGRGGTAIVYRARDRERGIDVAIKVMREDLMNSVNVERFVSETRQLSKLPHPHIVPVLDYGKHEGRPYFVLPFMDGGTLRDRLLRQKQLAFDEVISLGATIAGALEFAHQNGVIHRDVKPENILYSNGQPCLADFGTARAMERSVNDPTTSTGIVRGTVAYMSPEQASGDRDLDGRSDVYSLACVLYECVAGMQPFVGPTMQAVISQRLSHVPRPVSVYRPSVPPDLEQVLVKATALSPVDRYPSAKELADALKTAATSTARSTTPVEGLVRLGRRKAIVAVAGVGVVAIGLFAAWKSGLRLPFVDRNTGDTTLVAILPTETGASGVRIAGQDLFTEGLRRWTGVSFVETFAVNDAVRQKTGGRRLAEAGVLSAEEVAQIARSLGAGRFVRSQFTSASGLRSVYATLNDVKSGVVLHRASRSLPADTAKWPAVYADLTDSLMLRGARDDRRRVKLAAPLSLPAYQLFLKGRSALGEWDLVTAESLFVLASTQDSANAPAFLWLAQVRQWRGSSDQSWRFAAERALRDSSSLTAKERQQARALTALASGRYADACRTYRQMTIANARDFTGQYGLGDCSRLDRVIVPDSSSPSGFRFRASYEQAVQGFRRAFELLPSAHRTLQGGAYEPLRNRLFTINTLRRGGLEGKPSSGFYARVALDHDTVVFIPYPRDTVMAGPPQTDPRVVGAALTRNRRIFHDLVRGWRIAMPGAPGTREAFAISLEMLADPVAADSFAALRRETPRSEAAVRFGVEEAVIRFKLGVAGRAGDLRRAVALSDSLLKQAAHSGTEAELLTQLAVLTGRCQRASELAPAIKVQSTATAVSPSLLDTTRKSLARWSAGCRSAARFPEISTLLQRAGVSKGEADATEYELIGAVAAMEFPSGEATIRRLAGTVADYILRAEVHLFDGDTAAARRLLARYRDARLVAPPGDLAPDAVLVEARLWLHLRDTSTSRRLLTKLVSELDRMQPLVSGPGSVLPNALRLGSIAQAIELLNQIESDPGRRAEYMSTLSILSSTADPEVRQRLTSAVRR